MLMLLLLSNGDKTVAYKFSTINLKKQEASKQVSEATD